ncbi:uncharacterized protein I303_103597 [Kwoniella dejecticola CBS 10117]|uniref:6-phosphogluconolactonase n=1 Tax=Kwoniella dejecticola CBS 10117 TaxID=1296121 RepID=A0A1A6A771_9TREE|nr:uncharacterized protein I303_03619 [Kwoniella dejecticola CBS 10117]OBR85904.1 hypothetical protein I303_03619 [Kwoniella dejecticola CBS 10117]
MSTYQILVSGYRDTYTILSFDPSTSKVKIVSDSKAPEKASWIEPASKQHNPLQANRVLYSISEVEKGLAVSLNLKDDKIEITSQKETHGGPAHVHVLKDGSGLAVVNYMGGSMIFFPFNSDGTLSDNPSDLLEFPFLYKDGNAPNPERQDTPHAHQVIEGEAGTLYVCDLGNDRIWVVEKKGVNTLEIKGWLQAPPGTGPRHATFSEDGKHLYVLTELTSDVLVFSLESPTYPIIPKPDFKVNIIPPTVPKDAQQYMNAAELILNPAHPTVLYASNRLEISLEEKSKGKFKTAEAVKGDSIAIIELSKAGDELKNLKSFQTDLNNLRGMTISPDGKYLVTAGRKAGGLAIYETGSNGTELRLAGKIEQGVDNITDLTFL